MNRGTDLTRQPLVFLSLSLQNDSFVVLATLKRAASELSSSQKKLFKIDDNVGIAISGLTADGTAATKALRADCISHKFTFESNVDVSRLASRVADKSQISTQRSGARPSGVGMLIAGVDDQGTHLYQTCPSGNLYDHVAAAIGANLPISEATGSMVIDIGGGTTEIAVMSLGGVVYSNSLRVAGDAMDHSLISYMRREYNLMIGDSTAEKIKKEVGTAIATNNNTYAVKGRDLRSGTPKEVNISEEDTVEALNPILREMINGIKDALENTPPELSADLVDMGLTLTGGGALLKNIDKRFSKETGLPVHIADDPLACVAVGTGKALDQEETFNSMLSEY